jgi:ribose/xylose/arabinose/galactoside ABC-type transport system permease subunit
LLNVSPNWQKVVIGVVIVAAVWIDVLRQKATRKSGLVRK